MTTLTRELRRSPENTVREASPHRRGGARKVIEQLAVHHHEPPSMTPAQCELRNRLQCAHGRQPATGAIDRRGVQGIDRLTTECAQQHWFALPSPAICRSESSYRAAVRWRDPLAEAKSWSGGRGADWPELVDHAQRTLPQTSVRRSGGRSQAPRRRRVGRFEDSMRRCRATSRRRRQPRVGAPILAGGTGKEMGSTGRRRRSGPDELPAGDAVVHRGLTTLVHFLCQIRWARWVAMRGAKSAWPSRHERGRARRGVRGRRWRRVDLRRFVREAESRGVPAAGTLTGGPRRPEITLPRSRWRAAGISCVRVADAAMRAAEEKRLAERPIGSRAAENLFPGSKSTRATQIAAFNLAQPPGGGVGYRSTSCRCILVCSGLSLGASKAEWLKLAESAAGAAGAAEDRFVLAPRTTCSDAMKRGSTGCTIFFARAPLVR